MTLGYFARLRENSFKILVQIRLLWIFCAMAVLLAGCTTTPKYLRWYDGPALDSNKVAILKIDQDAWHAAMVDEIDGAPVRKGEEPQWNNTQTIELPPGEHQLSLAYLDTHGHSVFPVSLRFKAEGGHHYELYSVSKRISNPTLRSTFFGRNYRWTAWIIDSQNQEVVAGEKWEVPPRQFKHATTPKP